MTSTATLPATLDISLSTFEAFLRTTNDPAWLVALRKEAFENFRRLPWPSDKDDKWKRTGLDQIPWASFTMPLNYDDTAKNAAVPASLSKSVTWTPLSKAVGSLPDDVKSAWAHELENAKNEKFLSLALAFGNAGGVLKVARGTASKDPIVLTTSATTAATFPLVFTFVEDGTDVSVWDDVSEQKGSTSQFVCNFTGVLLGRDAHVSLYGLEQANAHTWHFQFQNVEQMDNSRFGAVNVSVGSAVFHNETILRLRGTGAENKVLGVLFGDGNQVFENWVTQFHTAPKTTSDIQYRGALKGTAKSFFSGLVSISKEGQQSDAFQSSKSLLLSTEARADAIPNLEILADDVKCSHGAAVGPVDEDQKFYLRTRGIPTDEAEELIVQGFFEPVIAEVSSEAERDRLRAFIENKLKQ